jgi:hypothetical protein
MVLDRQPPGGGTGTEGESWRTADKVAAFQGVPQTIWVRMETGRAARGRERLTGSMLAFVFPSLADPENGMDAPGEAADSSWAGGWTVREPAAQIPESRILWGGMPAWCAITLYDGQQLVGSFSLGLAVGRTKTRGSNSGVLATAWKSNIRWKYDDTKQTTAPKEARCQCEASVCLSLASSAFPEAVACVNLSFGNCQSQDS